MLRIHTVRAVARYVRDETSVRSVGFSMVLTFWLIYFTPGGAAAARSSWGRGEEEREGNLW